MNCHLQAPMQTPQPGVQNVTVYSNLKEQVDFTGQL